MSNLVVLFLVGVILLVIYYLRPARGQHGDVRGAALTVEVLLRQVRSAQVSGVPGSVPVVNEASIEPASPLPNWLCVGVDDEGSPLVRPYYWKQIHKLEPNAVLTNEGLRKLSALPAV